VSLLDAPFNKSDFYLYYVVRFNLSALSHRSTTVGPSRSLHAVLYCTVQYRELRNQHELQSPGDNFVSAVHLSRLNTNICISDSDMRVTQV